MQTLVKKMHLLLVTMMLIFYEVNNLTVLNVQLLFNPFCLCLRTVNIFCIHGIGSGLNQRQ